MSLILIGDICTIKVGKETRSWGSNLPEDGTRVKIIGYDESSYGYTDNSGRDPGIYENRCWLKAKGLDVSINSCFLELPKDIQSKRLKECQDWYSKNHSNGARQEGLYEPKKVRPLPETPFWPGDTVKLHESHPSFDNKTIFVHRIDYNGLNHKTNNGSPWPAYTITPDWPGASWTQTRTESELTLVSRGNVWKYYHEEKIDFPGELVEEANFYALLGHSWDVRNPKSESYAWTLDEALDALQSGLGDSLRITPRSLIPRNKHSDSQEVFKYRDEKLGKRIANATLHGCHRVTRGN